MAPPVLKLLDGQPIPQLAFGTGTALYGSDASLPVRRALAEGFVHIDTAQMYKNESSVGDALAACGIPRAQLFVTTKLDKLAPGESVADSLKGSLKKLQLQYVDLWLVHSPIPFEAAGVLEEVWRGMEACKELGLAKSIGVSNFRPKDLERVLAVAKEKPVVNQIEFHPYVQKQLTPLLALMKQHGILVESFGGLIPLTRATSGPVTPLLQSLAKKYGKTETQVLMGWLRAKGGVAVTTTSKEERLREYLGAFDVALTPEEVAEIDQAGAGLHFRHFQKHMEGF
ncbi:Aldo/keto reductase [Calocera viscosa TUFC12733]|uniref:Aldo/keto reductase n=1 Tax=Calocera viscosa (strain TUFC12733) TaxID=1330018 RepID=A0A167RST7_CALVF|nr:Aldo/keto reductase [Calocera viscosa TUFC12733]